MRITLKLFATFRNNRFKQAVQEHPEGTICRKVVLDQVLSEAEIGVIMINGRHGNLDQVLHEGDTLSLFPLIGGG